MESNTQRLLQGSRGKRRGKSIAWSASCALVAFVTIVSLLMGVSPSTEAADPTSGTLSPSTGATVMWNGTAPGVASPDGEVTCVEGTNCDTYTLTLAGAPSDWAGKLVRVKINWTVPANDYDFYVHKDSVTGPEVTRSGEAPPVIQEDAEIDPSVSGTGIYAIRVVYYAASGSADQYRGTASVEAKSGGAEPTPPPVSTAVAPTYDNFAPPPMPTPALGQRAGEPTIGLNWSTGRAMFIASLQTLRVTFNDAVSPATATWENRSAPNTSLQSFDPILFTDSRTNRTFVSQLLPTKASLMSFTDDDGETWTPSQGSGINSGVDHQTVGGGPYARNADGSLRGGAIQKPGADLKIYPNAVYYASQDIGVAEIARSDDGGLTFGVAVPMYDLTQCGGLHGHIKVAPDGTVYVPNKSCGSEQAVVVSEDNGLTWEARKVPGSKSGRTDPSVGIGSDGTIYFGYANADGKARVAVSRDKGLTWENDQDAGFHLGINNTVFSAVTAGDGDRAAFFFLGTTTPGSAGTGTDQTSPYFNGTWHGYVATTYDRGKTWVTVNATPNDPVQRGVICTNGTTCPAGTRNLLDFNDLEVDKQGRPTAALADGCISAECIAGVDKNNDGQLNTRFDSDGARRALIIRQSSGKTLFAANDQPPTVAITSPANNATFNAGSDITIVADAKDADGRVTRVDFFANNSPIGTATGSPFSIVWRGVAAGSYTLTAKATDNDNRTTTSAAVSITVKVPPPAAPSNLMLRTIFNSGSKKSTVWVNWTDNSTNEANFVIERSTTSATSGFTTSFTVGANTTAYTDEAVTSRKTYYYRVRAVNSGGNSGFSNTGSIYVK